MTDPVAALDDPAAVLADTRRLRKRVQDRHRRASLGDQLYQAYVTLFIAVPLIYSVTQAFDFVTRLPESEIAALDRRIAVGLPLCLALVTVAALRLAAWTGPVVVARADVAWLFSMPFERSRLILPRLRRAFTVAVVVGAVAMVTLSVAYLLTIGLDAGEPGQVARLLGTAVVCGGAYGLLLAALGWLVEINRVLARRLVRVGGVGMVALAVAAVVTVLGGGEGRTVGTAALASGLWGWTTAALLAAARPGPVDPGQGSGVAAEVIANGPVSSVVAGLAAAVAVVASAIVLASLAGRRAGRVPLEELRRRSATSAQVTTAAVYFADFRAAAQARDRVVRALVGRSRRRTTMPRRRILIIPWVGLTILLRQPRRIAQAWLWLVVATGAVVVGARAVTALVDGPTAGGTLDVGLLAIPLAVVCAYAAAGILIEPLRVENEQRFALRMLPGAVTTVGPVHLAVPALVLWALATATLLAATGLGYLPVRLLAAGPFLTAALAAVLTTVAAVVASGPPADGLWLYGGGPGYARLAFHLLRGPLLGLVAVLLPAVLTRGRLDAAAIVSVVLWAAAVSIGLGRWVQSRLVTY